jgi:hypothetical protein
MNHHGEQDGREGSEEIHRPQNPEGSTHVERGVGEYEGRDPKTGMPRVPSVPETQEKED